MIEEQTGSRAARRVAGVVVVAGTQGRGGRHNKLAQWLELHKKENGLFPHSVLIPAVLCLPCCLPACPFDTPVPSPTNQGVSQDLPAPRPGSFRNTWLTVFDCSPCVCSVTAVVACHSAPIRECKMLAAAGPLPPPPLRALL